jgi:hypothetical protein
MMSMLVAKGPKGGMSYHALIQEKVILAYLRNDYPGFERTKNRGSKGERLKHPVMTGFAALIVRTYNNFRGGGPA